MSRCKSWYSEIEIQAVKVKIFTLTVRLRTRQGSHRWLIGSLGVALLKIITFCKEKLFHLKSSVVLILIATNFLVVLS